MEIVTKLCLILISRVINWFKNFTVHLKISYIKQLDRVISK